MVPGLPRLPEGAFLVLGSDESLLLMHVPMSNLSFQELLQLELRHPFPLGQGSPPHRRPSRHLCKLALLAPRLHGY